ncbi:hypothetical protein CQY20_01125 [Mycolicibacterium agri]|uniref:Uncharacterized protein n=1 Tax=Mycolicibacterium agri TaxID=36811 RepID=A0A2A7NFJ1_MYCAG|nr:hypothetical protein [Mycolicibacterium agri]PEG42630.1 hypothetical protein CQY20_01125 [Mycolicibacterium agri]GFG52603.1 hypothetical protein MAGR_40440 [Mycolicibacterium agri]
MSAPSPRPRVVDAAFWCWVVAAVLLIVGGLITASVNLPAVFRGVGVLFALAGAGLALLAGRSRTGDGRFRRAALALSLATIVVVALVAVAGVVHILTLIAVIPLIAAVALITRPAAAGFYQETL